MLTFIGLNYRKGYVEKVWRQSTVKQSYRKLGCYVKMSSDVLQVQQERRIGGSTSSVHI